MDPNYDRLRYPALADIKGQSMCDCLPTLPVLGCIDRLHKKRVEIMAKRPRIQGKKIASSDMKIGIYINGQLVATTEPYRWSVALSTNHLPTLETYLQDAVDSEQYEYAAEIRDRIIEVRRIKPISGPDIETVDVPY